MRIAGGRDEVLKPDPDLFPLQRSTRSLLRRGTPSSLTALPSSVSSSLRTGAFHLPFLSHALPLTLSSRRTLVYVEANFTIKNEKDEATGAYSTNILATHGSFYLSSPACHARTHPFLLSQTASPFSRSLTAPRSRPSSRCCVEKTPPPLHILLSSTSPFTTLSCLETFSPFPLPAVTLPSYIRCSRLVSSVRSALPVVSASVLLRLGLYMPSVGITTHLPYSSMSSFAPFAH
jgi:hypothetical protein